MRRESPYAFRSNPIPRRSRNSALDAATAGHRIADKVTPQVEETKSVNAASAPAPSSEIRFALRSEDSNSSTTRSLAPHHRHVIISNIERARPFDEAMPCAR